VILAWTLGRTRVKSLGGKPAVPVALRRVMRRTRVKEIRSGSRSAASAARVIRSLVAWWTSNHAQISWWTSSGNWERRILPGLRRWELVRISV
jgi:hypothetical protein